MHPATRFFALPDLQLDSGAVQRGARLAYRTWGVASARRAVLVCHALTGSADADVWWPEVVGEGAAIDPDRDFIICVNVLGSCYGSGVPAPRRAGDASAGEPSPPLTVRDIVRAQALLLEALGVARLDLVIGGSLGGMQALEWMLLMPERVAAAVLIATAAAQTPWALALSEVQRAAIAAAGEADRARGLAIARMAAMCSYRHWSEFDSRFGRREESGTFAVNAWLQRHGERFHQRFSVDSYLGLLAAMDSHDVARGRGRLDAVLGACAIPTLVIGIDSDLLYPPSEQRRLARLLPRGRYVEVASPYGHDGFLLEAAVGEEIRMFRRRLEAPRPAPGGPALHFAC